MKNSNKLEYQIGEKMYSEILKTRKGDEKKMNPKDYVMKVINSQFGLRGTVVDLFVME